MKRRRCAVGLEIDYANFRRVVDHPAIALALNNLPRRCMGLISCPKQRRSTVAAPQIDREVLTRPNLKTGIRFE